MITRTIRLVSVVALQAALLLKPELCLANQGGMNVLYSGRLADSNGKSIPGPATLQVSLYDAALGGNELYAFDLFRDVQLRNGVFHISLTPRPGEATLYFKAMTQNGVYIQIKDATTGLVYPRQRIAAVPFALRVPVDEKTLRFNDEGRLEAKCDATPGPQGPQGPKGDAGIIGPAGKDAVIPKFLCKEKTGNAAANPNITVICDPGYYNMGCTFSGLKLDTVNNRFPSVSKTATQCSTAAGLDATSTLTAVCCQLQ